jgi:serine/threonine protein phosphatase PrpC
MCPEADAGGARMLRVVEQAFRTDTGRQRDANEDSYLAQSPVFAVADGMGGAQAGEVASRLAAESFEAVERGDESPEAYLRAIAKTANARIHRLAESDSSRSGMGTTLTAALVEGEEVGFAHVGDSQRSIITRALGPERDVEVDTMTYRARPGDVYLLCSDGLTTMVKEDRIGAILAGAETLDDAVDRLVEEANEAGGRDNITVVAFRVAAEVPAEEEERLTLVGPAAEEAGLTAAGVEAARRQEAERAREPAVVGGAAGAPRGRRWPKRALKVLTVLVVIAGLAALAVWGARQIYFLGTDSGGRLALYRGLPYELPFGIDLYSEAYIAPVQVSSIPAIRRESATDHTLRFHDDAASLLEDLQVAAERRTGKRLAAQSGREGSKDRQDGGGDAKKQGAAGGGGGGSGAAGGGGSGDGGAGG